MASEADEIDSLQRDDTKSVDPDKDEDEQGEDEEGKDALELTEDAEALKRELDKIVVHPPTIEEYVFLSNVDSVCKLCGVTPLAQI